MPRQKTGNQRKPARRTWHTPIAMLVVLATGVAVASGDAAANDVDGVFGHDERRTVEDRDAWTAVGQLNVSGYRERSQCSGVLVAPDRVLTAAHCVYDKTKRELKAAKTIHFVAGAHQGSFAESGRARCVKRLISPTSGRQFPAVDGPDLALVVLREPMAVAPIAIDEQPLPIKPALAHAGYPSDRRHVLSLHRNCTLLRADRTRWITSCDTNYGGSGGPVFFGKDKGEWGLAAIMYGIIPKRHSLAVPIAPYRKAIAETRCDP